MPFFNINTNMQSNKVEELTDKLEGYLSLDTEKMDKYDRYQQEGQEASKCGELPRALELFQLAYQLQPSDKLKKWIQEIQYNIQRDEEDEDEEFVDVNDSGLKLYKGLYDKLYDHQKEGVAFLYSLYRDGRKGGILADDMGLGKTIQVISFLSGMYDSDLANHTLLVMPTSLIKNWVREFAKWTPGMRVKEFHGISKAERNRNLERIQRKGGVVITTYQMLINNYEQLASYDQREFKWDYVILDEAHKIKTSSTKTAKSAHAIPAKHRVLLTGTPVQNNLQEMWALFDFACQGSLLGTSKTFKTEYEKPITRAREKDATPEEKALGLRISQNLMDIIKPYFLRRAKGDVQQKKQKREERDRDEEDQENKCPNTNKGAEMPSLPRKNDLIVWTYLSSVQEDIYKKLMMTTKSLLEELTVLKTLCDHPRLLSNRAVTQLGLAQGSAFDSTHPDNESESAASHIDYISDDTLIAESGKLQFLVSLMECLREEGHRTLIFSQSRKMLDIMERVLRNRNFRLLRLDGTVTQLAKREKCINLFQTDKRYTVFLLTTQVGGVGITLTAANRVVIFDPSWNPATDAQAVDRAYRIGQTENVLVYRLITCGTVEEKIYRRQVFKDSLIQQSTGDKTNPFRYFSKQELHELFKLEDTRSSTTQQQLKAMHSQNRCSDTKLDQHIAHLRRMEMFGVSDHDLMFTKEIAADEDIPKDAESHHFIQTRVQKAQELMQAESELHGQLMDSVAQNTEPAWLRQTGKPKSAGRDHRAPPHIKNDPMTVDLTHSSFSEPKLEEDEQSSPPVEEVAHEEMEDVGEKVQVEKESFSSGCQRNVHVLNTEVSPVADKQAYRVITLDDSSDEADKLCGNAASVHQHLRHSFPNPSHKFPMLEELSAVSDSLDNREFQVEEPHSSVLSPPPSRDEDPAGEPFKAEVEILQGNFILQLEDSADLFLVEEEVQEVEESEESPEFQLQMEISLESLKEASIHDCRQEGKQNNNEIRNYNNSDVCNHNNAEVSNCNGEVGKHEPLLRIHSAPDTPADDSFVHFVWRKRTQVIYDTEEGEISTSYEMSDANESHADESEVEEEPSSENKIKSYQMPQASETHTDESLVEKEDPDGETLNTEESESDKKFKEVEENMESRGDQEWYSALLECPADIELDSSEMMDQCAPKSFPLETHILPVSSTSSDVTEAKASENTYESLVLSGKQSLAEDRKQEALDFFLKAIDINTGDAEIQLLIIQLYRQLSQ